LNNVNWGAGDPTCMLIIFVSMKQSYFKKVGRWLVN